MTATGHVVLLAEPDQASSALYQRVLRSVFEVVPAVDKETVVDMLLTRQVRALVLDPMLFVENRWEQLAAVSYVCAERGVPLVICSTLDERRRGKQLGASVYLVKPTLPETLLDAIQQVCEAGGS